MILVIGDIAVDIVSRLRRPLARGSDAAAEVRLTPGGSGANVAVWLARIGQRVAFAGRTGDDALGRWLAEDLRAEGVESHLVVDPAQRTGVIQVLVEPDGERTMVPDRGANAIWSAEDVPDGLLARAELIHVVGYVLLHEGSRPGALKALAYARDHGIPASVDPSSHAPLGALGANNFWSVAGGADILLPNRSEARVLTGRDEPEEALEILLERCPTAIIKLDRDGCLAGTGDRRVRMPAPPADVVNSTGAGDAFDAGFLAEWLRSADLEAAARAGVRLGSQAVALPGTR